VRIRRSASQFLVSTALSAVLVALPASAMAQVARGDNPLNEMALRPHGQYVIPVYDGWFENPDGSYTFCFGYFNMNTDEAVEVPLGPGNHIEPARYDGVQPTHFDPVPNPGLTSKYRHYWCVFTVVVPEDFGSGDVVWTLASQGDTLSVPASLNPAYILDEPESPGRYAVAPFLRLQESGQRAQGRVGLRSGPRTVAVGEPLELNAWIEHGQPGTWLGWTKHQGPGQVRFLFSEVRLDTAVGVATTSATFDRPGRYVLRVQAINDIEIPTNPTYGFEFHCCWTNGYVEVDVVP